MKIACVIGRFQPFHIGHAALIDRALEVADKVLVIVGDTGCVPDCSNPWSVEERLAMISLSYAPPLRERISFASVEDVPYGNGEWARRVRQVIQMYSSGVSVSEVSLVGFKKDNSSFYLDLFPEMPFWPVGPTHDSAGELVNATSIREELFLNEKHPQTISTLSQPTAHAIIKTMGKARYRAIREEMLEVKKDEKLWECEGRRRYGRQPKLAADALVHTDDEILLIRRKGPVGTGAFALPGGFVNPDERLVDTALRELREETGIQIDRRDLPDDGLGLTWAFDAPKRSTRGRIVTNVLPIKVPHSVRVSPVQAGDDALDALWVNRSLLPSLKRQFFSDHYHIIDYMLNGDKQ